MPTMLGSGIERKSGGINDLRRHSNHAAHRPSKRVEQPLVALFDPYFHRIASPAHAAWPDLQGICALTHSIALALGHRPSRLWAIERHVQACMVERIMPSAALVKGREYRADESNDSQRVLAVFADRIDVPPTVAAGWNLRVEAWSSIRLRAACKPDKAAIGTPAPGCVAPPAQ